MLRYFAIALVMLVTPTLVFAAEPMDAHNPRGAADVYQSLPRVASMVSTVNCGSHAPIITGDSILEWVKFVRSRSTGQQMTLSDSHFSFAYLATAQITAACHPMANELIAIHGNRQLARATEDQTERFWQIQRYLKHFHIYTSAIADIHVYVGGTHLIAARLSDACSAVLPYIHLDAWLKYLQTHAKRCL